MRLALPFRRASRTRRRPHPMALAFQPDALEIAEAPPDALARWVLYGIQALILAAVAWASLASIDQIVSASGRLVTVAPTVVIQPLETSVIRSLDVRVGDLVRKGQVLATLDSTFAQADVEQLRARRMGLDAQIARLEAEMAGVPFEGEGIDGKEKALQHAIDANRRAQYRATLTSYDERLDELAASRAARQAEPLYTLVPVDVPLEAEVQVRASDIGYLKAGDDARVKFTAFPFQKHGVAHGRVRTISENSFQAGGENGTGDRALPVDGAAEPVYRCRVVLTDLSLRNLPAGFRLLPGMTLTAEIRVGERRVISYFTYPFLKGLDESLREP